MGDLDLGVVVGARNFVTEGGVEARGARTSESWLSGSLRGGVGFGEGDVGGDHLIGSTHVEGLGDKLWTSRSRDPWPVPKPSCSHTLASCSRKLREQYGEFACLVQCMGRPSR